MALNVKAFLEKNGDVKGEIRRFQLQPTVFQRDTYQALKNKVAEVFSLTGNEFRLYWQDQDGDFVVFSSTNELQEAVSASEADGLLRIYVKRTGEPDSSSGDQASGSTGAGESNKDDEKVFHPGVVCDGCEGSIYGPRYKCIVCPDYDLCSACEQKGKHPEHDKIKITHPQGGAGHGAFVPPHFRRWMHRFMKKCQTGQSPCGANASASGATGESSGANREQQGTSAEDEYLKNIGENIASFLDPFGIDVTYEVHHGDQANRGRFCGRGRAAGGRGRCGRGAWGPWMGMWTGAGGRGGAMPRQARPTPGAEGQKPSETPVKAAEKPVDPEQQPDTEREVPMGDEATQQKTADDSHNREASPAHSEEDWTMLNEGEPTRDDPEVSGPNAPGQQGGLYPNLQVQQAVETMKAMGFSDDGGWLTRLLETTNGDIAQALDTLKLGAEQAGRLG